MGSFLYLLLLVLVSITKVSGEQYRNITKAETSLSALPRTFFYDDHQVFFTIMVYFPFIVNSWSYGIPFDGAHFGKSALLQPGSREAQEGQIIKGAKVVEHDEAEVSSPDDENENSITDFHRRSLPAPLKQQISEGPASPKSRPKRTLYIEDQVINLFLCLSLPFSVPLLKYDQDLLEAYKNKKARKEHEKHLPSIPVHENEFESQYNEDDTYGEEDEFGTVEGDDFSARAFGGFAQQLSFGSGRKTHRTVQESNRRHRHYVETVFEPVSTLYQNHTGHLPLQLWSPADPTKNEFIGRSSSGFQDTASALASNTLVGVDSRVVDLIESFPHSCTQLVLCRLGRSLINASPLQALLLHTYKGIVFGYGDSTSEQAFDAALDGDSCESMFQSCELTL